MVTAAVERFDFSRYAEQGGIATTTSRTLPDGTYQTYHRAGEIYITGETPADSYFTLEKIFHSNGSIREKGLKDNFGVFKKGVWYHFDQNGAVVDEVNHDLPYSYSFEQLLAWLLSEGIPVVPPGRIDPSSSVRVTTIYRQLTEDGPRWYVRWWNDDSFELRTIDGKTGKVLAKAKERPLAV